MSLRNHKVYWDDYCYVCFFEIEALKRNNPECNIEFINISSLDNKAAYMDQMVGEFDGKKTVGPDTIRRMYYELGHHQLVTITKLPLIKQIFNLSYKIFAYFVRPFLPKRL